MAEEVVSYLSLGSNEEPRELNLARAVEKLAGMPLVKVEAVSRVIETEAQGEWKGRPCGKFLNCCVRISTSLSPDGLLDAVKGIEKELGREGEPEFNAFGKRVYSDRPIDIDILLYGNLRISTDRLQIPHPRMEEREFVMKPLKEIYAS